MRSKLALFWRGNGLFSSKIMKKLQKTYMIISLANRWNKHGKRIPILAPKAELFNFRLILFNRFIAFISWISIAKDHPVNKSKRPNKTINLQISHTNHSYQKKKKKLDFWNSKNTYASAQVRKDPIILYPWHWKKKGYSKTA